MTPNLLSIIKKAALDAVENNKMCDFRLGTVISTSPMEIQIDTSLTIPSQLIIVPESLTNHIVSMTIDGKTTNATVNSGLKVGNKVILLRKQGGQSYLVLDRIN